MPIMNASGDAKWSSFRVNIDAIEARTGLDLLSNVPASVQQAVEAGVDKITIQQPAELITSINTLWSNANLQKFAEADCSVETLHQKRRTDYETKGEYMGNEEDTTQIKSEADLVVNGDTNHNEAGLKELVNQLINSLK